MSKQNQLDDTLGNRMKEYENCYRQFLPKKLPWILRLDGVNWHSLTKKCKKPFDENLIKLVNDTAMHLCKSIQGAKIAYCQSDEISILIYENGFDTQPWFRGNLNKILSKSAAKASSYATFISEPVFGKSTFVEFDSRVFILPMDEVNNAFEWRQQDCSRNSVSMVARAYFSHKQCDKKSGKELQEMLFSEKSINWNDLPTYQKRGRCVIKNQINHSKIINNENVSFIRNEWMIDNEIPIFHENVDYISKYLKEK